MHTIQKRLLKLIDEKNIGNLTLRQTGKLIGENLPQKIKHHLSQLERKGFILLIKKIKKLAELTIETKTGGLFISVPIVGSANCGPATIYADQNIEGYIKISKRFLLNKKSLFAIKAEGNSMNKANIAGKNIEAGDYVIVDSAKVSPRDGDYVVSVIDDMANIKKYRLDRKNSRIVLLSESTQEYSPIFIHKNDNFIINGKVIDVIKRF